MPSACSSVPPPGQRRRAVEDADVVQAEEAALEEVAVVGVLAVDPPGEVRQQPLEHPGEELAVALASDLRLALVDVQRRPRGHRRVDVAEVPLVCRDLAVRVQVPRAEQQLDLLLGEVDVDERQRRAVEREVPRGEPRVLPLVGHRDDVARDHVEPRNVPDRAGRRVGIPRVDAVLAQPPVHVVLVVLLAPQQPGQRLAHHHRLVAGQRSRDHRRVELVGLVAPRFEHAIEVRAERRFPCPASAAARRPTPSGAGGCEALSPAGDLEHVVGRDLGARPLRVDRVGSPPTTNSSIPSLTYGEALGAPNSRSLLVSFSQNSSCADPSARSSHSPSSGCEARAAAIPASPSAAVEHRLGRPRRPTTTCCGTTASAAGAASPRSGPRLCAVTQHHDVVGTGLGVLDDHVEVAVVVEDPGVQQLVLHLLLAAATVGRDQIVVRERPLRILVLALQVRVRRRAVEVEPVLLDVLAVVALADWSGRTSAP